MAWFKESQKNDFIKKVKHILKNHTFTQSIAKYYHIPIEEVDTHLKIEIVELDGKFAEGNGKIIRIDKKLLNDDFFNNNFHFIIHEFFHWLKRRSEEKFYFNDPEEVQSFVIQMAWGLINGQDKNEIIKTIYPIVKAHYKNDIKFEKTFKDMVAQAITLYKVYEKGGEFSI